MMRGQPAGRAGCPISLLRIRSSHGGEHNAAPDRAWEDAMETYNVYMDESPVGVDTDGGEGWSVEFRVVPNAIDDGDPENNAVLAGLDLIDLINLRDALQAEIDTFALAALEDMAAQAEEDEIMP
jgi:hypothetical protein